MFEVNFSRARAMGVAFGASCIAVSTVGARGVVGGCEPKVKTG